MAKKKGFTDTSDIFKSILSSLKVDNSKSVVEWILNNDIRTEDNLPVSYENHKYLIDFMNDLTPKQAIMASAQVGKSVSMYIKSLYMNFKGLNVAFSEPTADLRDLLTKSKLNRIIENSEIFRHNVTGGMDMKTAFDRMMFLVYTYGNAGAIGYTTDLNVYDEVSRSNPITIDMLKSRQLNSKHKMEWFISNPSAPHDLLHRTFLNSDQKYWFIKCDHCNHWQLLNYDGFLGFEGNVNKELKQFCCQKCKDVLSPESIINGKWVARYDNRDISGYHIHQLMRPTHSYEEQQNLVKELIYEEEKNKQSFYNMFLGLPYSGSDITVDPTLFKKNVVLENPSNELVCMGVDIGASTGHHYVIGSGKTVFALGRAKDWKEIRLLMKKYKVQMCTVDQNPENGPAREFQAEYPNMVWRANYVSNKMEEIIRYAEEDGLVHVARNIVFDNIINDLAKSEWKFAFSENDSMFNDFIKQFCTLSKIAKFDAYGNPTFSWSAPDGAWDHFAHAFLYYTVAYDRLDKMLPKFGIKASDDEFVPEFSNPRNSHIFGNERKETNWLDL